MTIETRLKLIADLRYISGFKTHLLLMDWLQERGLVSDNAVTIEHVPDGDLSAAFEHAKKVLSHSK